MRRYCWIFLYKRKRNEYLRDKASDENWNSVEPIKNKINA